MFVGLRLGLLQRRPGKFVLNSICVTYSDVDSGVIGFEEGEACCEDKLFWLNLLLPQRYS